MPHIWIIALATVLLSVVLFAEKGENRRLLVPSKGILSLLFVLAALVEPRPLPGYQVPLLWGLVFCLLGDICLALPQRKAFLLGLFSFLIGHAFYVVAFLAAGKAGLWTLLGALATCGVSGWIYRWLSPHLGRMRGPVVAYILLITAMVACAFSVLERGDLLLEARVIVLAGAICFYLSDIFVARDRFVRNEFLNRAAGLPLYYAAQFLLAFSTALV
ncbi:MAG: lysoplasmalogenase [Thermodesulfobacteriota bacterium]